MGDYALLFTASLYCTRIRRIRIANVFFFVFVYISQISGD